MGEKSKRDILLRLQEVEKEMYQMSAHLNRNAEELAAAFTVQDTDFLIRILNEATVRGADATVLTDILKKLTIIHKTLIQKGVEV